MTWGDVYFRMLSLGYDHGYAAYRADLWEERQKRRGVSLSNGDRG